MNLKPLKPTESELEILRVLWERGKATVRDVHEELSKTKDAGYTTTLKLMQIMYEKGLLTRVEDARSHVYEAKVSEEATQATLLERFVGTAFRGSASKLVMQALGSHKTTPAELDEIRKLLDQIEQQP